MLEKNAIHEVIGILQPESFYIEHHKKIFEGVKQLFDSSCPIDILTVTNQLRSNGTLDFVGGPAAIAEFTSRVASAANIEFHATIIQQKFMQRSLIRGCSDTIREAYNDTADIFDLCERQYRMLGNIDNSIHSGANIDKDDLYKWFNERNAILLQNNGVTGVPSGFMSIDKRTGGYQPGDLIIIAARPGMGKTAFALENALNASLKFGHPIGFFSVEMSAKKIFQRAVSSLSGITLETLSRIGSDKINHSAALNAAKQIRDGCIHFDDTPALKLTELRSKARKMKNDQGIKMIIIDYLQLMQGNQDGNREQEISSISRGLKQVAKELDIPVIALAQLNRSVETRGGEKVPMLSDLRESGQIEQDADIIEFIYRPEYYKITELEGGIPTKGIAQIIIAKNRDGASDDFTLKFDAERVKFSNLEDNYFGKLDKETGAIQPYKNVLPNENFDNGEI